MLPKKRYFCYNLQAYFPKTHSDYRVEINYVLFHASLYYSKKEICPHPAHFFISYLFFRIINFYYMYCSLHIILLNPTIKMRFRKSRLINYREHNVFQTTLLNVSFNYDWRYLNSLIQGEIFFLLYIWFFYQALPLH